MKLAPVKENNTPFALTITQVIQEVKDSAFDLESKCSTHVTISRSTIQPQHIRTPVNVRKGALMPERKRNLLENAEYGVLFGEV